MKLIITIDTEEDNWARYHATENTVENIKELVPLQNLLDEFGFRPTYLISYPVAASDTSLRILKDFFNAGKCEIGMHCHPWNTPPFEARREIAPRDTMLCNLPPAVQQAKLAALHRTISDNFGAAPVSFRAGRWAVSSSVLRVLRGLGYRVDSSVTPFVDWRQYAGPDFTRYGPEMFTIGSESISPGGDLLEVPVTVGFLQPHFGLCRQLMLLCAKPGLRRLHGLGILQRLSLLNKVWLSPEHATAELMIKLAKRMQKNNYPFLNLSFHSTTLLSGSSPFVRNEAEKRDFVTHIRNFLTFARTAGYQSCTLGELKESAPEGGRMLNSQLQYSIAEFSPSA